MTKYNWKYTIYFLNFLLFSTGCQPKTPSKDHKSISQPSNVLNYLGTPQTPDDRKMLIFSDQGAWFGYSFPAESSYYGGFSGPFLMTQENGVWASPSLSQLQLTNASTKEIINWKDFSVTQTSKNSHLEQVLENKQLKITHTLAYSSAHSVLITTQIDNLSDEPLQLQANWLGTTFLESLSFEKEAQMIKINSEKSTSKGLIQSFGDKVTAIKVMDSIYTISLAPFELKKGTAKQLALAHSFVFPEYSIEKEQIHLEKVALTALELKQIRVKEKEQQLAGLYHQMDTTWKDSIYQDLLAKTVLTLQNNWRIPAGELKNSGLFPSYHYIWFHGIWAWDSWKHAVALVQYDTQLAKEQIRAMYAYQSSDGFIPDCLFRDTSIEKHNYRNTKPPLSAWAVWKVYEKSSDLEFVNELYLKIIQQHKWWYSNRDHDKDGICEYGSSDGTLIAAKWESGMDNAVRFDSSKILSNSTIAFSLDQESVDLNAYLYAEKKYLQQMATALGKKEDATTFETDANTLKDKIQKQFFDEKTGWFYDTSIDGTKFITAMGCEGWIPLWANVASNKQAEAVKNNMMDSTQFNTNVPFQTLSASHPKFKPNRGYWRGPNWLDQAYFGVVGLHQYNYHQAAYRATHKLLHNAEGLLSKGESIRENYHPITGQGLESESFSWSAAHYLLLLVNE